MGKELQPKTFKLDEGHVRKLAEIEDAFAPFTDGKSATVRFLVDTMHALIFTKGTLEAVVESLQGLLRITSYYRGIPTPAAPDAVGKGLAEAIEDDRKPRPQPINRRTVRLSAVRVRQAALGLAWLRPSWLHLRPSFAGRQA